MVRRQVLQHRARAMRVVTMNYHDAWKATLHDVAIAEMYPDWSCRSPRNDLTEDELARINQETVRRVIADAFRRNRSWML